MEFSRIFALFIAYFTSYINAEVETPVALPLIGGNLADKNQFKYQVSLQRNGVHLCGGGIIADQFVLTAAHCVINGTNGEWYDSQITVLAGVLDSKHEKGVEAEVEAIYVPENYDFRDATIGDIAVLKLKNGLGLDKNNDLMRLRLPNKIKWNYPSYVNATAIVTGYGWTNSTVRYSHDGPVKSGSSDGKLRYAEADIINITECNSIWKIFTTILPANICARVHQSSSGIGHGVCYGDSGGPLVLYSYMVIGIISRNWIACRERSTPGIYTRVSSFIPFINDVLHGTRTSNMRVATLQKSWNPFADPKFVGN